MIGGVFIKKVRAILSALGVLVCFIGFCVALYRPADIVSAVDATDATSATAPNHTQQEIDQFANDYDRFVYQVYGDIIAQYAGLPPGTWTLMQYEIAYGMEIQKQKRALLQPLPDTWENTFDRSASCTGQYGIWENGGWVYYPCSMFRPYTKAGVDLGLSMSGVVAVSPHFVITGRCQIIGNTDNNSLYLSSAPSGFDYGWIANSRDWSRPGSWYLDCDTDFFVDSGGESSEIAYFPCSLGIAGSPPGYTSTHGNTMPLAVCGDGTILVLPEPAPGTPNTDPIDYYDNTLYPYLMDWAEINDISKDYIFKPGHVDPQPSEPTTDPYQPPDLVPIPAPTEIIIQPVTDSSGEFVTDTNGETVTETSQQYAFGVAMLPDVETLPVSPLSFDAPANYLNGITAIFGYVYQVFTASHLSRYFTFLFSIAVVAFVLRQLTRG